MNIFLDTNVMLGFVFETDKWNSKSFEVMKHSAIKYSSDSAQKECNNNYNTKLRKLLSELRKFKKEMRLAKTLRDVELFLQDAEFETGDILSKFLHRNSELKLKDLINKFDELQLKTEQRCHLNYNHILKVVNIHSRSKPYTELYQLCVECGFVDSDPDDVEIIIDAHDLSEKINPLFFITGDYRHIISRKEFIITNTSLSGVIGLGEFTLTSDFT